MADMSKIIFTQESGNSEKWLEVNDDGTVTHIGVAVQSVQKVPVSRDFLHRLHGYPGI